MRILFVLVAALMAFGISAQQSSAIGEPQFYEYQAQVYSGRVSAPDLQSHRDARTYRTRLRNAAKAGRVNFAGQYVLATWGCGTSCLTGGIVNARTGQVHFLPFTVCCSIDQNSPSIDYRADSHLIIFTGLLDEDDPDARHYYQFRDGRFTYVDRVAITSSIPVPVTPAPPIGIRTQSSKSRIASSGSQTDVTDYELINDLGIDFTVRWLNGSAIPQGSNSGQQIISPGQSWRIEHGARTWESHWYLVSTRQGDDICSISPRQGESVRISELYNCAPPQTVTPTCPSGYSFSGGQCRSQSSGNPPRAINQAQCVASCEQLGDQCDATLNRLGNAQGWDGDLRRSYWNDTCVPQINACKFSCNPNRPIGPGECRFTRDGGQICS
ncbi:MAG: hypothetical protein JKY49_18950 [Cohaesibacteraceae bacterium]|nr:hypothetical protein [Cohaesibacteraceae bacterium]MBL4876442.1 hypothetical protein [Cohaesibacteraceae bacterium]